MYGNKNVLCIYLRNVFVHFNGNKFEFFFLSRYARNGFDDNYDVSI